MAKKSGFAKGSYVLCVAWDFLIDFLMGLPDLLLCCTEKGCKPV